MNVPPMEVEAVDTLRIERAKSSFDVREMMHFLEGGEQHAKLKELALQIVERDPELRVKDYFDIPRPKDREKTMRQVRRFVELKNAIREPQLQRMVYRVLENYDRSAGMRLYVHEVLFRESIWTQGSKEQWEKYKDDIQHMRVIGCYSMTELGHSSYLQGLETTATYDKAHQEFIIHTPTLTATKWWIGMAGQSATHTVALCRLLIDGHDLGLQWFIIPLRSPKDGRLLPGVTCGDIGAKTGRNGLDNGWLQFTHVRIPRENMLMRWAQVSPDGKFSAPPNQQLVYTSLIGERMLVVPGVVETLSQAVTIAVRYGAARRQGPLNQQIIDYQGYQYRVCPIIATIYALSATGRQIRQQWERALELSQNIETQPQFIALSHDFHALTAGMKAWFGWWGMEALENCRRCLGGHGYSAYNNIAALTNDYAVLTQGGGDNLVLAQQCARYLVSSYRRVTQGKKVAGSVAYLSSSLENPSKYPRTLQAKTQEDFLNSSVQLEALRWLTVRIIEYSASLLQHDISNSKENSPEEVWNNNMMLLIDCSKVHTLYLVLNNFLTAISEANPKLREVLKLMSDVYALHSMESVVALFLEHGYMNGEQVLLLRKALWATCRQLRHQSIPLTDAFGWPDWLLKAPFGKYDGGVYSAYFDAVNAAPHSMGVPSYWSSVIKPLTSSL